MTTAVCELGPTGIRRLAGSTGTSVICDPILGAAALDGGDGRTALVGDEPVPLPVVWRATLQPLLAGADRTLLIHPSWWPVTQLHTVRDAAAGLVHDVEFASRATVLTLHRDGDLRVIEIGPELVAVVGGNAPIAVHSRGPAPHSVAGQVAAAVLARRPDRTVLIDAPAAVPGAEVLAALIAGELSAAGTRVRLIDETHFNTAATTLTATWSPTAEVDSDGHTVSVTRRLRRCALLTAGLGAVVVAAGVSVGWSADPPKRQPAALPVSTLVEGRVVMDVPADWTVRRITDGPGSARVQVMSSVDDGAVLHLTQSRVPAADLAAAAAALRRAIDNEAPGTFVDFNPTDTRVGRPAITYRELRPEREILWVVLADGDLRISVGCQHASGRSQSITEPCDDAVRSARQIR
jgi:type VII secretion-associated protein (TIGR03931 family)